jgi:hypothetical protein
VNKKMYLHVLCCTLIKAQQFVLCKSQLIALPICVAFSVAGKRHAGGKWHTGSKRLTGIEQE